MAEAAPIHLYSVRDDNDRMKQVVSDAGGKTAWDKPAGAFKLVTEGMAKKDVTALKKKVAEFTSPEAKAAWEADRAQKTAEMESLRGEAKARETTTKEPRPAKAPAENVHMMYRTPDERTAFTKLLKDNGAKSTYIGKSPKGPHFSVVTTVPDKFAHYMGDAAKARFDAWSKEQSIDTSKNPDVEVARAAASSRGKAFMAQAVERGFRLSDPSASAENHQRQLDQMRGATDRQLVEVIATSRALLAPLREKELQLRSESSGLPVAQLKEMSFSRQIEVSRKDGNVVGLTGDDFKLNLQLSRGVAALQKELDSRGVGQTRDNAKAKDQEAEKAPAQEKSAAPQSAAKGRAIAEENSVDNTVASLTAAMGRRGQGR